jgi:GC-rich sequence DNA-binding factor
VCTIIVPIFLLFRAHRNPSEEDDDETIQWEQAQLRRGGHLKKADKTPVKRIYKAAPSMSSHHFVPQSSLTPIPVPPATAIPTLAPTVARLRQSLNDLNISHAGNITSISSIADEREQLAARETEMREMITKAEAKRSWFAAFRDWVESVATFLDEKVRNAACSECHMPISNKSQFPQLENLEKEHLAILKERSNIILQRRRADDEDDLSRFFGVVLHSSQPSFGDAEGFTSNTDMAAARQERRNARIARRLHRKRDIDVEEGYSTDSSLPPSDTADFKAAMRELLADKEQILGDVQAEEFKDPDRGLGKWFGEWRSQFGDTYTGAWGGLGLVAAWEFWTRLELMGWNPFDVSLVFLLQSPLIC